MLPLQNFVDKVSTVPTAWLNEVDNIRALKASKLVQGVRSNTIIAADDTELIFPVVPAGVWRVEAFLQFQGSVTGGQGFQAGIFSPGSGSQVLHYHGIVNSAPIGDVLSFGVNPLVQFATIATAGTDFVHLDTNFATGGGKISLQWSQRASNANATLLNTFSWMIATRLI
jgi:hypothetical protein